MAAAGILKAERYFPLFDTCKNPAGIKKMIEAKAVNSMRLIGHERRKLSEKKVRYRTIIGNDRVETMVKTTKKVAV